MTNQERKPISLVFWYRIKCYASFLTKHIMIVELWLSGSPSMKCVWHNFSSPSKFGNLDKPHVLDGYVSKRMQCHLTCLGRHVMRGNLCVDDSGTKTYIGKFFLITFEFRDWHHGNSAENLSHFRHLEAKYCRNSQNRALIWPRHGLDIGQII